MLCRIGGLGKYFSKGRLGPRHLSSRSLRDLQLLERCYEVKRGAGYLCPRAGAARQRRVRFLTQSQSLLMELYRGWPPLSACGEELKNPWL